MTLSEEVAEEFAAFEGFLELGDLGGYHIVQLCRSSRAAQSDEERRIKRKALEICRRAYKAAKQREYKARRKT